MKTNKKVKELLIALLVIAPIVYFFSLWNSLPDSIPIHFDRFGNPNNYGSKMLIVFSLTVISLGVYVFLKLIPRIYNKDNYVVSEQMFYKTRFFLALFFSVLCFVIIFSVQQEKANTSIMYVSIAFLISIIGNYMGSIKPNFLNKNRPQHLLMDEKNWKKTQNFLAKLWFFSGIVLAILIFIMPADYKAYALFSGLILVMIIVPVAYSLITNYRFKKENKNNPDTNTKSAQNSNAVYSDGWVGLFYINRNDKRIFLPKRSPGLGWTLNFGNPFSYFVILGLIAIIILMERYLN